MSHEGRAQVGRVPDEAAMRDNITVHRGGQCVAGTLPLPVVVKIGETGRAYVAQRDGEKVGGIIYKPGGWFAFEIVNLRMKWSPHGRIRPHFAARDLWGTDTGAAVARLPEIATEVASGSAR